MRFIKKYYKIQINQQTFIKLKSLKFNKIMMKILINKLITKILKYKTIMIR